MMTAPLLSELILDIRKDVKGETRNISIIANTALSAFTDNPINLAVVSPSSEGKTYLTVQTLRRFPQGYIWMYRKVSPKTFTRERGTLAVRVIKDNIETFETVILNKFTGNKTNVGAYLKSLKDAINDKKNESNINPEEAQEALSELEDSLYTLVDFRDKILVFLDRPDPALWNELLSVLSHDKEYIVTSFVEGEGFKRNRRVVFQGWPAVIFCTSKEEDFNWKDLETRFQIIEPVMKEQKYREALEHNFKTEYALNIKEDNSDITERLEQLIEWIRENRPKMIFPFPPERLVQALTQGRVPNGDLMRKLPRIVRHVAINALFNRENRILLYNGHEHAIVIAYEDIMALAYLFDDVEIGASFAGLGTASYELLTKVIMPLFTGDDPEESNNTVKQSVIKQSYKEYLAFTKHAHVSFSPATFTRRMKELEQRGLIKRVPDDNDKRGLNVIPTWSEVSEGFSLIQRLRDLGLRTKNKKLVSPWKIQDFSYLDHLEKLNYTAYWKNRKLVSHDPEIIENEKMTVLEILNFTRILMKASGYNNILRTFCETIFDQNEGNAETEVNSNSPSISENANIERPRIFHSETIFNIPFWDKLVTFYYTGPDKNIFITQEGEEISGTYEIRLRGEDILSIPEGVASPMEQSDYGKILNGRAPL
jgi:DNA-binding Lrp family transcriptional regulator